MEGGNSKVGNQKKEEFIGTYKEYAGQKRKCITLHDEEHEKCVRPFPYNLPDIANNLSNPYATFILKIFSLTFIISLLCLRIIFASIFNLLSDKYQNYIKGNKYANTLTFLMLSGLIGPMFSLMGHFNIGLNFFSPYTFISLIYIIQFLFSFPIFLFTIFFMCAPKNGISFLDWLSTGGSKTKNFYKYFPQGDETATINYYKTFSSNIFKKFFYALDHGVSRHGDNPKYAIKFFYGALNILCNIVILFFTLIILIFAAQLFMISGLFAYSYFYISTIIKLFYYPLVNSIEFYDIMKSHSNTLTLIFCILVFVAASQSLHIKTRGYMGAALAVIFAIKIYSSLKD
jgi:hypothetical protein